MSAYLARGRRVGARSRYARAWPEHPGRPSGRLLWTLGSGAEGDALRGRQSNVEDRGEAAVDHAPAVEKAVVGVQARVVHDLRPGGVAGFLGRPFDPGIDDGLAVLRLYRPLVIGGLAVRQVVAPGLDDAQGARSGARGVGTEWVSTWKS